MKILEEAKKLGLERQNYKIEETDKNMAIAYTSWQTELRKGQRIDGYEDAIPLLYMMQKEVPNCSISKFFVDVYGDRNSDRRKEWKNLVAYCRENTVDYIIIPSFQSLSYCVSDVLHLSREIRTIYNAPKIYFVLEGVISGTDDFEHYVSFWGMIQEENDRLLKKKKMMLKDVDEGDKKMQTDESFADNRMAKFMEEFANEEKTARSRRAKIAEDIRQGAKQLREWNKMAAENEKKMNSQK